MARSLLIPLVVIIGLLGGKLALESHRPQFSTIRSLPPVEAHYRGVSLKQWSLGFDRAIAAMLWIQLIQNARTDKIEPGRVSWEYSQLDAITTLDHKFSQAYSFGAVFLSVFRQDKLGAKLLLEKWSSENPQAWRPAYLLGYHLFFELRDYPAASQLISRAASMEGAPGWLASLGVRLLTESGATAQALQMAIDLYSKLHDAEARERLAARVRRLRIALEEANWREAIIRYREIHHRVPERLEEVAALRDHRQRLLATLFASDIPEALKPILSSRIAFEWNPKSGRLSATKPEKDALGIFVPKQGAAQ